MENNFEKEVNIREKTEDERNSELLLNIVKTSESLKQAHKNFEFAEEDLVDYYSYNIKAYQSKLDYLIKLAKEKGLVMNPEIKNRLEFFREVS